MVVMAERVAQVAPAVQEESVPKGMVILKQSEAPVMAVMAGQAELVGMEAAVPAESP